METFTPGVEARARLSLSGAHRQPHHCNTDYNDDCRRARRAVPQHLLADYKCATTKQSQRLRV